MKLLEIVIVERQNGINWTDCISLLTFKDISWMIILYLRNWDVFEVFRAFLLVYYKNDNIFYTLVTRKQIRKCRFLNENEYFGLKLINHCS